jgi:hypothetical protein
VARRLLAAPTVRLAKPADAEAIRAFRCGYRPWYVQNAAKVVRRSASLLDAPAAVLHRTRVLLFETQGQTVAIAVVQEAHDPRIADLVVLALHQDVQGGWLKVQPPRPLCVAVLDETIRFAGREGYEQILAVAAEQNTKSVRLITLAGFARLTLLDGDYALYQAAVLRPGPTSNA